MSDFVKTEEMHKNESNESIIIFEKGKPQQQKIEIVRKSNVVH
jgi:hypothetical protein